MALWPNRAELARDCGVGYTTAQQWSLRGNIPAKHWSVIIKAAEKRGVLGVSLETLARMADEHWTHT